MAEIKNEIDKRGVSDEENAELVKKYGGKGVYYPFDRPGGTVAIFLDKKKKVKKAAHRKEKVYNLDGPGSGAGLDDLPTDWLEAKGFFRKEKMKMRKGAGTKAWETRRANIKHKKKHDAAVEAWKQIFAKNFNPAKIKLLRLWNETATPRTCVVCGDKRHLVLQIHHATWKGRFKVTICANCHDVIRRGKVRDLQEARKPSKG